jgi:amidase
MIDKLRAAEAEQTARVAGLLEDHDVLMTPTLPTPALEVGRFEGRGALWTVTFAAAFACYVAPWNATGLPAASVPVGLTSAGLPIGAQFVGRESDEATLISLAAELEAERPWAERTPPIS